MKRMILVVVFGLVLAVTGCTDDTPKTPELVNSNEDKDVTNLDEVDSVKLSLDGNEVVFPDDFTHAKLSERGLKLSGYDGTFIPTVDENGILDVKYSDKLHIKYYPDNYLVSNIDSMYMTGIVYSGENIEILSDLSEFEDSDIGDYNSDTLVGDEYTIKRTYEDEKVVSLSIMCNQPDDYYRLDKEYEVADDIIEYDITESDYFEGGGIRCKTDIGSMQIPEDIDETQIFTTVVRYNYAFKGENPTYIVKEVVGNNKVCGLIFSEDKCGIVGMEVGKSIYESLDSIVPDIDTSYRIIKLVDENIDYDIYIENSGNAIRKIMLVERDENVIVE